MVTLRFMGSISLDDICNLVNVSVPNDISLTKSGFVVGGKSEDVGSRWLIMFPF